MHDYPLKIRSYKSTSWTRPTVNATHVASPTEGLGVTLITRVVFFLIIDAIQVGTAGADSPAIDFFKIEVSGIGSDLLVLFVFFRGSTDRTR